MYPHSSSIDFNCPGEDVVVFSADVLAFPTMPMSNAGPVSSGAGLGKPLRNGFSFADTASDVSTGRAYCPPRSCEGCRGFPSRDAFMVKLASGGITVNRHC